MTRTPLKRSRKPIARKRAKPRRGPLRDPAYLDWIRQQPCAAPDCDCARRLPVESAHVGERGLGQKCSDRETIPLCAAHHRTSGNSVHFLGRNFWASAGLNRDSLIGAYNQRYHEETGR
jgi:hypothetical protein